MADESKEQTAFDKQLEARGDWEKFKISGDTELGESALGSAQSSGYANEGKSNLLENIPELSAAYDRGVTDSAVDYAIDEKENQLPHRHLEKYGPEIPPTVGTVYEGKIVWGDSNYLYQESKVGYNEVLIRHDRKALHSTQAEALLKANGARIQYLTPDYATASVSKELTGPNKEMGREK